MLGIWRSRLFWKFLVFFFLAQLTAVVGVGLGIWATLPPHPDEGPPFERTGAPPGPPPGLPGIAPPPPFRPGPPLPVLHLLAGALVSLVFAALLAAYVSHPIHRLRQALRDAAEGRLAADLARMMGDRRDELADLGLDYDRMVRHLAQLMDSQRTLLHDVSHELRSPLARVEAIIDVARQQPESVGECLTRLEHESRRIDALLGELLTLSRLESGLHETDEAAIDLDALLADVLADALPEAELAGCRVELDAASGAHLRGNAELLHRCFDNLLRNALTHAASGGWVGISVRRGDTRVEVRVSDRGPGLPDAEFERIFEPFYRARRSSGKGSGLGLAIARRIVSRHAGDIHAESAAGGGLVVCVRLPCDGRQPAAQSM